MQSRSRLPGGTSYQPAIRSHPEDGTYKTGQAQAQTMSNRYSSKIILGYLILLAAGCGAVGAFVTIQDPADEERKRLQGEWEVVSIVSKVGKEEFKRGQMLCIVAGEKIISKEGAKIWGEANFTLDPSKSPKTIDLRSIGDKDKARIFSGIYEFDDPDLKICIGSANGARPTKFGPLANQSLIILKRLK
jgi:uncharacterized protein (TIGR03067 family)